MQWCSESCDCNKDQYDRWNALWLLNPKNNWCENMSPSLPQSLCRGLSSSRSLPQTCAEVSAAQKFDYSNSQSRSILNAPPSLQVVSGARENALAESESILQSSRVAFEHLKVLGNTGEGYRSVLEVCVWLPNRITFCWCSLSDVASSDNGDDGDVEENNEDTQLGKPREDDEPGWAIRTISKMVQHCMKIFQQQQMRHDQLTQLGLWDAADYFCERDKKYKTAELNIPAVIKAKKKALTAGSAPSIFGQRMETQDIVTGISQRPHRTSQPGCSHMRLSSRKPQSYKCIVPLQPDTEPNSFLIITTKPVEPILFYHSTLPPKPIPIQKSDPGKEMVMVDASHEE